jgi:hypothetical protein
MFDAIIMFILFGSAASNVLLSMALQDAKHELAKARGDHEWIEWNGGEFPENLDPMDRCHVRLRNGLEFNHDALSAGGWRWGHDNGMPSGDIVAYRIIGPHA